MSGNYLSLIPPECRFYTVCTAMFIYYIYMYLGKYFIIHFAPAFTI